MIAINYRHKISEFKYVDIKDLINKIKHNTTSEISAKEGLYVLKQTKNAETIKYKKRTARQKESLNLFKDLSDTILTDETLESKSQEEENKNKNENENDNKMTKMKMKMTKH